MTNTIIYLIGFAGTGKLTIARELCKKTAFILVDNHSINNVIFSLVGDGSLPSGVWDNIARVRTVVFDTIRDLSPREANFIFTNELIEDDDRDRVVFDQVCQLAADRDAKLLVVRLLITADELVRRVVSPERKALHKETHPENARRKHRQLEVLKPQGVSCRDLDVSALSPSQAAAAIMRAIN